MQNLIKEFIEEYSRACRIDGYIDVVSEVGELGKEILNGTEYGKKESKRRDLYRRNGRLSLFCSCTL